MKFTRGSQQGQFVIEGVLLMVVMLSLFVASTNALREGKYLSSLIERPWGEVQGMLECGVWGPPSKACKSLPGQLGRQVSLKP